MDVEGAEYLALRGAARLLGMSPRPVWLVEIGLGEHHPTGANLLFAPTFEIFWSYGYRAYTVEGASVEATPDLVAHWSQTRRGSSTGSYLFQAPVPLAETAGA